MKKSSVCNRYGVSLIEILIGLIIVVVASIATLTYFSSALGGVGKTGNRRAALERSRQRLEVLVQADLSVIAPPSLLVGQGPRFISCNAAGVCSGPLTADPNNTVDVDDLVAQNLQSTIECKHDAAAGTPDGTCDVLELSAKVWFIPGSTDDDDFHRVHVRTLRNPF